MFKSLLNKFKFSNKKIKTGLDNNEIQVESEFNKLTVSDNSVIINHENCYIKRKKPWCKECVPRHIIEGWTSGNHDIDEFIKDTICNAKYDDYDYEYPLFLEWVPFDRFKDIKQIGEGGFAKVYSATWIDGNTRYERQDDESWEKGEPKPITVALKKLNGSQNMSADYLNEPNSHWKLFNAKPSSLKFYGMTKDPEAEEFMMVMDCHNKHEKLWCKECVPCHIIEGWTSENHDIDEFIKDTIYNAKLHHDSSSIYPLFLEWVPFDRFKDIKQIGEGGFAKVYSATWIDGKAKYYKEDDGSWKRGEPELMTVALKRLNGSQNMSADYLNELKTHWSFYILISGNLKFYGITKDPKAKEFMMVMDCCNKYKKLWCKECVPRYIIEGWTSGNHDIDEFIKDTIYNAKMFLDYNKYSDYPSFDFTNKYPLFLEWVPFNRFKDIKQIGEDGFAKVYSATWIDGKAKYYRQDGSWKKKEPKPITVALKRLNGSQNISADYLNELKTHWELFNAEPRSLKFYGMTKDPETEEFMMVMDCCNKYEKPWCKECVPRHIIEGWTSGNHDIDEFIKDTIYNAKLHHDSSSIYPLFLEWVPFDRFKDIKQIGEGGFAKVFSATWIDGKAKYYRQDNGSWKKGEPKPITVALKRLNGSQNMSADYLNELKTHWSFYILDSGNLNFYGMTKDPETEEFMMVMQFAEKGNLRCFLSSNFNNILWKDKINYLRHLMIDLNYLHKLKYFHKDFHSGNILQITTNDSRISDFGLSGPANEQKSDDKICGVLPYIAPEVLNKEPYTLSSDIYSFGVIMAEFSSGKPPFYDRRHDHKLALAICNGLRPEFGKGTPEIYKKLAHKCMNANPNQRPTASELKDIFDFWNRSTELKDYQEKEKFGYKGKEIRTMFEEADKEIPNISTSYEKIPDTIYTSRIFTFKNLSKPINSSIITSLYLSDDENNEDCQDSQLLSLVVSNSLQFRVDDENNV